MQPSGLIESDPYHPQYGQKLEYDAWGCFCLCEEAPIAGEFTERNIKNCFKVADEAEMKQVGLKSFRPTYSIPDSPAISTQHLISRSVHSSGPPYIGRSSPGYRIGAPGRMHSS